jgi:hypothetical protein
MVDFGHSSSDVKSILIIASGKKVHPAVDDTGARLQRKAGWKDSNQFRPKSQDLKMRVLMKYLSNTAALTVKARHDRMHNA